MRWLVDAHVPRHLVHRLREQDEEAIHTLDLLVATGNIDNQALETLFLRALPTVIENFGRYGFIELSADTLIIHG